MTTQESKTSSAAAPDDIITFTVMQRQLEQAYVNLLNCLKQQDVSVVVKQLEVFRKQLFDVASYAALNQLNAKAERAIGLEGGQHNRYQHYINQLLRDFVKTHPVSFYHQASSASPYKNHVGGNFKLNYADYTFLSTVDTALNGINFEISEQGLNHPLVKYAFYTNSDYTRLDLQILQQWFDDHQLPRVLSSGEAGYQSILNFTIKTGALLRVSHNLIDNVEYEQSISLERLKTELEMMPSDRPLYHTYKNMILTNNKKPSPTVDPCSLKKQITPLLQNVICLDSSSEIASELKRTLLKELRSMRTLMQHKGAQCSLFNCRARRVYAQRRDHLRNVINQIEQSHQSLGRDEVKRTLGHLKIQMSRQANFFSWIFGKKSTNTADSVSALSSRLLSASADTAEIMRKTRRELQFNF